VSCTTNTSEPTENVATRRVPQFVHIGYIGKERKVVAAFSAGSRRTRRTWHPKLLTSSARTNHTEISRRRFSRTPPGSVEPISRFFKLAREGVSNTLRAGTDSARGAFTSPRPIHYERDRCITVREMARLHGFPDWFRFHKTKWHGARQVGNAVPPPLGRAIAAEFVNALGIEPSRPTETLSLGDPELLAMDMTRAGDYWGVDIPIGKRDRKSGAKKRRQEEIEALRGKEVSGLTRHLRQRVGSTYA